MIIAVILCPPDLVLLVRSGPVIRDLGGSVRIWGDNGPVLISYFYDGAVPVKVFQNRSQSDFYMDIMLMVQIKTHAEWYGWGVSPATVAIVFIHVEM